MFPFDPPEKVFKGFRMFSGGSKRNIGKKRVNEARATRNKLLAPIYVITEIINTLSMIRKVIYYYGRIKNGRVNTLLSVP